MRKLLAILLFVLQLPFMLLLLLAFLAPFLPPDRLSFPAFAGLAFPWIYLGNLILSVLLLFIKPRFAVAGVLFILLGLYDITQHIQWFQDKDIPADNIKFLSYNCQGVAGNDSPVKGQALLDSIAVYIRKESPDIVCLQEFRGKENRDTEQLMSEVSKAIGTNHFHYQRYFVNDQQNRALCLSTFSKYPIIGRNAMQLGKRRIGMFTDIVAGQDTIRVFNIHLQSTRIVKTDIDFVMGHPELQNRTKYKKIYNKLADSYALRAQQARLIALEIKKSPYPVVVCGDFNDTPTSFAYHRISENLQDSFIESGKGMGNSYNSNSLPPIRIDYILYDKRYESSLFEVGELPYSDHFPISTHISRKK